METVSIILPDLVSWFYSSDSRPDPTPHAPYILSLKLSQPNNSRNSTMVEMHHTAHEATLSRHTAHWSQPAAAACRVVAREHSPSNCDTTAPDCGVSLLKPALPQPSLAFLLVSPPNILPTDFRLCTSSTLAIGGDPALLTERHVPSLVRA
jgi:hypothetical protein